MVSAGVVVVALVVVVELVGRDAVTVVARVVGR